MIPDGGASVSTVPLYTIALPEYTVDLEPDYLSIGKKLDRLIETHFPNSRIAIRGISLTDHPSLSVGEFMAIVLRTGTDKYDPSRQGVLHEFYAPYEIDLFALPCTVADRLESSHCEEESVMGEVIGDFYTGPPVDRGGPPLRLDLLVVYDRNQLEPVFVDYGGEPETDPCDFRFRYPDKKPDALLGIVQILR